jgi:LuxR family maltose regulon positive regulatory protein
MNAIRLGKGIVVAHRTPRVDGTVLVDVAGIGGEIVVGSPAWYAWLEEAKTFAFRSAAGSFTARKERRAETGWYWKAYRKHQGVLHRAYLGKSTDLTIDRLTAIASELARRATAAPPRESVSVLSASLQPTDGDPQRLPAVRLPTGTLTFLFTDIEGSTQLWEQHPSPMRTALARHDAILRQAVAGSGGVVFKTVGDGVHAAFSQAADALGAALAAQHGLHVEPWGETGPLRVRMALHTGAAELRDGDYFGPALNRVARMLALGHGGQILLSHATHDVVADDLPAQITLRQLGAHALKDLSRPEQLFQLVSPDVPADFPPLRTLNAQPARAPPAAPLLASKLFIPTLRPQLVPRPHLLDRLMAGLHGPLTLLAAPAGFGKTTLLSTWHATTSGGIVPLAWLSLDAADRDPARFWSYVITALDTLQPGLAADALPALQYAPAPPIDTLLTRVLNALATLPADAVLVLDDYHVIDTASIHEAVAFVLDHLPPRLHLVITTRADPPLPLARLRARGYLTELRAADLRFTPDEATTFLTEVMGLGLTPGEVATLEARTEGWIAGLQLAALAMRDRVDYAGFIAAFTGSNRFVVDYLAAEVLDRMPAHLQRFVLQSSILDRLCGPLCDTVLGLMPDERPTSDSYGQLILDQLERANLFLMPLDDDRQWYRYHHLFAEVLRERLVRGVSAEFVAELHSRASAWFEQHGFVHEAVQHALLAHAWDTATRLIEQAGLSFALSGKFVTVLGWIQALPEALVRTHPALCIAHAAALFLADQMERCEARLQDAEQYAQAALSEGHAAMILGQVVVIRANMARRAGDIARCIAQSRQALDQLAGSATIGEATALVNTSRAYQLSGDVSPASEHLVRAAITTARVSGSVFTHLHALTTLGRLQRLQGRLRAAAATYAETVRVVGGAPGMHSPAANVGLGELHLVWNDLDAAERQLSSAMDLLRVSSAEDADIVVHGYLAFAQLQQARGDGTRARVMLAELIDVARERAFWPGLVAHAHAARAKLAVCQGDLPLATEWAASNGLPSADDLSYTNAPAYLTLARVWIAQGRNAAAGPFLAHARQLLDRLHAAAEADGRSGDMVEILILRALALQAQSDLPAAWATLAGALSLAEPEGMVRIFVDEGAPMAALLAQSVALRQAQEPRRAQHHAITTFAERLLSAFPGNEGRGLRTESAESPHVVLSPPSSALLEPLSKRELEVLHLIAAGHSNQAIADRLIVAVSTVKKHVNNIYGKLEVQSRTQALARARELHLL